MKLLIYIIQLIIIYSSEMNFFNGIFAIFYMYNGLILMNKILYNRFVKNKIIKVKYSQKLNIKEDVKG
jgi:hypothetical protein